MTNAWRYAVTRPEGGSSSGGIATATGSDPVSGLYKSSYVGWLRQSAVLPDDTLLQLYDAPVAVFDARWFDVAMKNIAKNVATAATVDVSRTIIKQNCSRPRLLGRVNGADTQETSAQAFASVFSFVDGNTVKIDPGVRRGSSVVSVNGVSLSSSVASGLSVAAGSIANNALLTMTTASGANTGTMPIAKATVSAGNITSLDFSSGSGGTTGAVTNDTLPSNPVAFSDGTNTVTLTIGWNTPVQQRAVFRTLESFASATERHYSRVLGSYDVSITARNTSATVSLGSTLTAAQRKCSVVYANGADGGNTARLCGSIAFLSDTSNAYFFTARPNVSFGLASKFAVKLYEGPKWRCHYFGALLGYKLASVTSVASGGSGFTNGTQTLTMQSTGSPVAYTGTLPQVSATVSGGAVTAVGSITNAGNIMNRATPSNPVTFTDGTHTCTLNVTWTAPGASGTLTLYDAPPDSSMSFAAATASPVLSWSKAYIDELQHVGSDDTTTAADAVKEYPLVYPVSGTLGSVAFKYPTGHALPSGINGVVLECLEESGIGMQVLHASASITDFLGTDPGGATRDIDISTLGASSINEIDLRVSMLVDSTQPEDANIAFYPVSATTARLDLPTAATTREIFWSAIRGPRSR